MNLDLREIPAIYINLDQDVERNDSIHSVLKDCGFKVIDSFLSTSFLSVPPRNIRQLTVLPIRLVTLIFGKSFSAKIFGGQSLVVYAEIDNNI